MAAFVYVELDLFAAVLLVCMLVVRGRGEHQTLEQRLFNIVLLSNMLTLVFDALQWLIDGWIFPGAYYVISAVTYAYYIMNVVVPFTWLIYCDYMTYGSINELRRRLRFYLIPFIASLGFLTANLWTGCVFYIDAQNMYHRGAWFVLAGAVMFSQAVWAEVLTVMRAARATKVSERQEFRLLSLFIIFPAAGYAIQTVVFGLPLTWVAATLSLFLIYIKLQNRLIYSDELTGVSNRRQIAREFNRRVESVHPERRLYAVMVDADDFKRINDTFGHAAGDAALVRSAELLKRVCAPHRDFLARLGGDEFLILATRPADEALRLLDEIDDALDALNCASDAGFSVALSCGVGEFGVPGVDTLDRLLSAADRAMFENKAARKMRRACGA